MPRDLETIILKAIEEDLKARYASAEAMAEDLRRFLDDEPILARRVGAAERYLRWARCNPAIAILGAMLTAVLVGATIASVVVAGRMAAQAVVNEGEKLIAQEAQKQAVAGRCEAEHQRELAEQHQKQAEAEGPPRSQPPARAGRAAPLHRPDRPGRDRPPPGRPRHRARGPWTCAGRGLASWNAAAGNGPTSRNGAAPS